MTLIQRIEAAKEPSAQLFGEVFWTLRGTWPGAINAPHPHYQEGVRFLAMLDAEAWTSAAEMLAPDGWGFDIVMHTDKAASVRLFSDGPVTDVIRATHPSLALLSAILRALKENPNAG